jgi:hypothetical protein
MGKREMSEQATTFYGSCPKCGAGYWADVAGGPHSPDTPNVMCGPIMHVVCQAHHPVADAELFNSGMFSREDREKWSGWREQVEAR